MSNARRIALFRSWSASPRRVARFVALTALLGGGLGSAACSGESGALGENVRGEAVATSASALSESLVLRTVYPGGGSARPDTPYTQDFVVVFNRGAADVSLDGLALHYTAAKADFSKVGVALGAVTLAPGQSYLVALGDPGTAGAAVPSPDLTAALNLGATAGKVALATGTAALGCGAVSNRCATNLIIDLLGYGTDATDYEGSRPAPGASNALALQRKSNGCAETDENGDDFEAVAPVPRSSKDALQPCGATPIPTPGDGDAGVDDASTEGSTDAGADAPGSDGAPTDAGSTPAGPALVVSQVYGGGGNGGAPFVRDFVELFNRGTAPVSLDGLSIQYGSATGRFGDVPPDAGPEVTNVFALPNATVAPGKYFLVALAEGASKTAAALPTPEATGGIALSGTNGKVALVRGTTALQCGSTSQKCAADRILDLVGYGTAVAFEGAAPVGALGNDKAALRKGNGCTDTNDNAADFTVGAPAPRNGATPAVDCSLPQTPNGGTTTGGTTSSGTTAGGGTSVGSTTDAASAGVDADPNDAKEACSCHAAGAPVRPTAGPVLGLLLGLFGLVRRRRTV